MKFPFVRDRTNSHIRLSESEIDEDNMQGKKNNGSKLNHFIMSLKTNNETGNNNNNNNNLISSNSRLDCEDTHKSYVIYFPHNNIAKVLLHYDTLRRRSKQYMELLKASVANKA